MRNDDEKIICCLLGVCCPVNSAAQADALATWIKQHAGEKATPEEVAAALLKTFALGLK